MILIRERERGVMPLLFWLQPKEVGAFRKDSARERRSKRCDGKRKRKNKEIPYTKRPSFSKQIKRDFMLSLFGEFLARN